LLTLSLQQLVQIATIAKATFKRNAAKVWSFFAISICGATTEFKNIFQENVTERFIWF